MEGRCPTPHGKEELTSEQEVESDVPAPYDVVTGNFDVKDAANIKDDGRIDIDFDSKVGRRLASLVGNTGREIPKTAPPRYSTTAAAIPHLNIVIQIVGSRGDVQPFVALGHELQQHGHRVRIATHPVFAQFVRSTGLEFFSIGGDPEQLMAYMVKNPGLIPNMTSVREGDIQKKRKMISNMLDGCWRACVEPDEESQRPFVADAIIANPPSFAHVHCAQALGVPLHVMFTMPWTSTEAFPHPLANIKATNVDTKLANYLSYGIVQWLTWQGLGGVINKWRKTMDLEPIPATEGPFLLESLRYHIRIAGRHHVPAPEDWPNHIDVCGFFFRETPKYSPPADLEAFLATGDAPIFIGFGSIVIEHPDVLTTILLQAIQACGVRATIQKGWSRLGGSSKPPKDVFYLDDCPHEWLFKRVSAVIHHGGAGTTACGLLNGRPTTVVPFFGDQPFWGDMVSVAGAGPQPIPYRALDSRKLEQAILFCLTSEVQKAAESLGMKMRLDHGIGAAVSSFHRNLPVQGMLCELLPRFPAVWQYQRLGREVRLSKPAAEILTRHSRIDSKKLRRYESKPIMIENHRWDPFTGSVSAALGTASAMVSSTADIFVSPFEEYARADKKDADTAAAMLTASAKSVGRFHSSFFKGTIVDIPLAATEGLRAVPRLYGEEVRYTGTVTDWRSGATVAGKTLAYGLYDGLTGLATQPYKGAKEEGWAGFGKGIGKGASGLVTKPTSAILGLVAYPGQGICQSLRKATHRRCQKAIAAALRAEGTYMVETRVPVETGDAAVLAAFDALGSADRDP